MAGATPSSSTTNASGYIPGLGTVFAISGAEIQSGTITPTHLGSGGNGMTIAPTAATSGTQTALTVTTSASTGQTASTEIPGVKLDAGNTRTWATGAITTQREVVVLKPTYAFVGASTVTNAATFAISGAPVAGTNATLTNKYALWVQTGTSKFSDPVDVATTVLASGAQTALKVTTSADTACTASTEVPGVKLDCGATREWATGALTTQREVVVLKPTYAFVGASTLTNAASFAISGAPVAGTNATITNKYALWVQAGTSKFADPVDVATTVLASGAQTALKVTTSADTACTASTEVPGVKLDCGATREWATGALTTQREVVVLKPTYAFVGASTLTDAASFAVSGAPVAGTNATITRSHALWVQAGSVNLGRTAVTQITSSTTGVTSDTASGVITTVSLTTAAATLEAGFTVTCAACHANSAVVASISDYSGTWATNGYPHVYVASVAAGSFVIKVGNSHASNALSGTVKIHYHIG